jgi:ATP-dependent RNA helicase RhlE
LDSFYAYGANTPLKFAAIYGGVPQSGQERALRNGADVVIATPGRLMDLINQRIVDLGHIEILVLDEADRMLDMGFLPDIRKIMSYIPKARQTLFFSATMPRNVQVLADTLLNNPARINVEQPKGSADRIEQSVFMVSQKDKGSFLVSFLGSESFNSAIVFTRTRHGADKVVMRLRRAKIYAEAIHGDKSQSARQRTLDGFRNRQVNVLVATDIAARGIDVDHITHVVNFDLPREADTYIHRIGRTARAGAKGKAVSFCDSSERSLLRAIEKLVNRKLPIVQPKFEFVPEAAPEKSEAPMRSEPYRKVTPSRQVAAPRSSGSSGSAPGDYPRRGSKNKSQKTKYNKFKSSGGGGGNSGGHRSSGD